MLGLYILLNLAVLIVVARASSASGARMAIMLFWLGFIVGSANNLLEALVFGVLPAQAIPAAALPAALMFAILAPAAVVVAGRWRRGGSAPPAGGFTPLTLLGVVVSYELLYWSAGTLVYPYIAHFYAAREIPPFHLVAALQIIRALIFVGAAYPLLKTGLRAPSLVLALVYGIVGAMAPLLPDNPFMPANIRFYHAIETTTSNFAFGLIVGFLFVRGSFRRRAAYPAPLGSS